MDGLQFSMWTSMAGKNVCSTACSVCQRFSYRPWRGDAWNRHLHRPFSSQQLTPYRLMLLLTAAVICTKSCYLFTIADSIPSATTFLMSGTGSAQGTQKLPVGQKKTLTPEEEDETAAKSKLLERSGALKAFSGREEVTSKNAREAEVRPLTDDAVHPSAVEAKGDRADSIESSGWGGTGEVRTQLQELGPIPIKSALTWEPAERVVLDDKEKLKKKEEREGVTDAGEKVLTDARKEEEGKDQSQVASTEQGISQASKRPPSTPTKESSSDDKKLCPFDDACWCEGVEGEEKPALNVSRHLRGTDAFLSLLLARPFFNFPFFFSPSFDFEAPVGVHSSGPCRFTFTLDPKVSLEEARLYAIPSKQLVVLAADRKTKRSVDCKTYHEIYGESSQLHAVAVVPDHCMLSEQLVEAGLVAWSCAGKTSAGSRKILVTFPSKAHATELLEKQQVVQEAYDALIRNDDLNKLLPGEKCLLSGRTPPECDRMKEKVCEDKDGLPSFSSVGYGHDEVKLSRLNDA